MSKTLAYLLRYLGVSIGLFLVLYLVSEAVPGVMDTFTYPPWTMLLGLFVVLFIGHLAALVIYVVWDLITQAKR